MSTLQSTHPPEKGLRRSHARALRCLVFLARRTLGFVWSWQRHLTGSRCAERMRLSKTVVINVHVCLSGIFMIKRWTWSVLPTVATRPLRMRWSLCLTEGRWRAIGAAVSFPWLINTPCSSEWQRRLVGRQVEQRLGCQRWRRVLINMDPVSGSAVSQRVE